MKNLLAVNGPVHHKYRFNRIKVNYSNTYNELLVNKHYVNAPYLNFLNRNL